MNDYRRLTDFTDDEIRTILTDIFNPVRIENIVRHENDETITVDITTDGWTMVKLTVLKSLMR